MSVVDLRKQSKHKVNSGTTSFTRGKITIYSEVYLNITKKRVKCSTNPVCHRIKMKIVVGSAVSAQLCPPPKLLTRAPLMVIYKKSYVMLNIEAEWTSKQNILIADTILAEPGP